MPASRCSRPSATSDRWNRRKPSPAPSPPPSRTEPMRRPCVLALVALAACTSSGSGKGKAAAHLDVTVAGDLTAHVTNTVADPAGPPPGAAGTGHGFLACGPQPSDARIAPGGYAVIF